MENNTKFDPKTKIWSGPERKLLYHPDLSIGDIILSVFSRDPKKVIQINDSTGKKLTCEEVLKLSIAVAENLSSRGFKQDKDLIGIISKNADYLLPVVYGAFMAGIPFNTLDPSVNIDEINHMFGNTRPSIIFCDQASYENSKQAVKNLQLNSPIYVVDATDNKKDEMDEFFTLNKNNIFYATYSCPKLINGSDQTALVLCSSGTTGPPKGVSLSHRMLVTGANNRFFSREDVLLSFSTLYWLSGINFLLLSAFTAACRIITDKTFTSINALDLIEKYKVTGTFMTPAYIAAMVFDNAIRTYDIKSMKLSFIAGSILPVQVAEKMQSYLKTGLVCIGYAMTETAGLGATGTHLSKPGAVGKPMHGVQIRIIDVNTNEVLDPEMEGEVCIKTGVKWKGYYNNEEATKEILDEEGWIHTGDLGRFDKDGYLFIKGRKKETFKYKNFHIYPGELELIISEISGVKAVSVVGLFDNTTAMDYVAAAIIKDKNLDLTAQQVEDYVAERVTDYKKLRGGVYFLEELPMTPSGKIIKKKVVKLLESIKQAKL